MAARPSRAQARLFGRLLAELEPEVRRGFMASVVDLHANVNWPELLESLSAGDIEGAIRALNIAPEAWAEYSRAVTDAYARAGAATATQIVQLGMGSIGVRFNLDNPRAQQWIRNNVANKVVNFSEEQIMTARNIIAEGYSRGDHPRRIALDIAGRVGAGGVREGGILGLDNPRAMRFHQVRVGMRTAEGVRGLVIEHRDGSLSLKYKVNKATANRILSAYRNGTEVPETDRIASEKQYHNALLKHRADTIAETETGNAVMSARDEEWQQLMESEGLSPDSLIKTWQHRRGAARFHRPDHLAMSGTSVRGINTPFVFPDGTEMLYAHDPNGGAKHTIRCACDTEYRIDRSGGAQ